MFKKITEQYKTLSVCAFVEKISTSIAGAAAAIALAGKMLAVGLVLVSGVRVYRHEMLKKRFRDMLALLEHAMITDRDLRDYKVTMRVDRVDSSTMFLKAAVTAKGMANTKVSSHDDRLPLTYMVFRCRRQFRVF